MPEVKGFTQQSLSAVENGGETAYVVQIAVACGVDPIWLATGTGDMRPASASTPELNSQLLADCSSLVDEILVEVGLDPAKIPLEIKSGFIAFAYGHLKSDGSIDQIKLIRVIDNYFRGKIEDVNNNKTGVSGDIKNAI